MPCAATVLANSAVYYKGNKEPRDWLVRQFIYILCSIFIYFKMINSAEAPRSSQSAGFSLAQRLRARWWLAGRLLCSCRGGCAGGCRRCPSGWGPLARGLLRRGSRFPSGKAAHGRPLHHRGLSPARRTTQGKARSRLCSHMRPSSKPCWRSLPFISIMYIHFGPPHRKFFGFF